MLTKKINEFCRILDNVECLIHKVLFLEYSYGKNNTKNKIEINKTHSLKKIDKRSATMREHKCQEFKYIKCRLFG